jgi:hypothetical protein
LIVFASFGANAQGVAWEELSLAQRDLLADQEAGWADLAPERQQRIAVGARRYIEMNRRERSAAEDRFMRWQQLSDRQRSEIRDRYASFRQLTPAQRDRLRRAYQNFNRLSPDQRNRLRQQFRDLSLDQRQRALRDQLQDRRRTAPVNRR